MSNIVKVSAKAQGKGNAAEIELPDTSALMDELPPDVQNLLAQMEKKQINASVSRADMQRRLNQIEAKLNSMPEVVAMVEERNQLRKNIKKLGGIVDQSGGFIAEALHISTKNLQGKTLVEKSKNVSKKKELMP